MIGCLIIHGYTGGPYEVKPLEDYLRTHTDWQISVPVLEGHGKQLHLEEVTYEVWLEETQEALENLQTTCDTIYLIGFSMGGMIAAYLAANNEIDKLVLLSTARKYLSFKYMSYYVAEMIRDGFRGKLHENDMYNHYKTKVGNIPFRANVEFMKLVYQTKPYLKEVASPVFIAQGHKDGMVPFRSAYSLEEEIGSDKKEIVFFEEVNHLICLGPQKKVLNEMILKFLKSEDSTTKATASVIEE